MATTDPLKSPGSRGHNAPCSNRDFDFFYRGLEAQQLLAQRCAKCGVLRNPPSPSCPHCRSLDWDTAPLSGRGVIHSYTVHYHPPLPGFATPHPVALIAMEEGVRFLGAMDGTDVACLTVGLPVRVEFLRRNDVAAMRFRPAD